MDIDLENLDENSILVRFSDYLIINTKATATEKELKPILNTLAIDIDRTINSKLEEAGYGILSKHLIKKQTDYDIKEHNPKLKTNNNKKKK